MTRGIDDLDESQVRQAAKLLERENERLGQGRGRESDPSRWAKVFSKSSDEGDGDARINLSDFEMDYSESGR